MEVFGCKLQPKTYGQQLYLINYAFLHQLMVRMDNSSFGAWKRVCDFMVYDAIFETICTRNTHVKIYSWLYFDPHEDWWGRQPNEQDIWSQK